eukprot:COSAG02_NODE_108_length_36286_cov_19.437478_14_plen_61_part_00
MAKKVWGNSEITEITPPNEDRSDPTRVFGGVQWSGSCILNSEFLMKFTVIACHRKNVVAI